MGIFEELFITHYQLLIAYENPHGLSRKYL